MCKKDEYSIYLQRLSDEKLQAHCENVIYLSALAVNNDLSDFHWKTDLCFSECERRNKPEIYKSAYNNAIETVKPIETWNLPNLPKK